MKINLELVGGGVTQEVNNNITNVTNYYSEVNEATGFVDPSDSTLAFNDTNRTFTISPVGDSFVFWAFGTRYEKTEAESVQIDNVEGLWYVYYDADGDLGASQTIWNLSTQVPVATVLWSSGTGTVNDDKKNDKPSKFLDIYIMAVSVPGTLTDAQVVLFHVVAGSESVELSKHLPYSNIKCGTAPTLDATFDILVNDVSKGSATIEDGETTGSFTWNNKVTLSGGDIVKITGPSSADSTLADVAITLEGFRV
jgi:hypothetical protein